MKSKFLTFLPSMRWIPHDIPQPDSGGKKKSHTRSKLKPHRLLSLKPTEPDHGAPRRRKSTLSFTSMPDEELDARTHMQAQSMFFERIEVATQLIHPNQMCPTPPNQRRQLITINMCNHQ